MNDTLYLAFSLIASRQLMASGMSRRPTRNAMYESNPGYPAYQLGLTHLFISRDMA